MRALGLFVFAITCAGTILLSGACGKDPETPVAEASADAEPAAINASMPDTATAALVDAAPMPSASTSATPPASDAGGLTTSTAGPVVTDADADKTFDLAKGQTLTVSLAANPTSGFDWSVTKAPKGLGTPDVSFEKGGAPGVMGAGGKRKLVFTLKEALPAGEHSVELGYARGFEKGVAPFKTFKFKIRAAK